MEALVIFLSIIVGLLLFWALYKPFFGEERDFWVCVGYTLKPDIISWFDKDLQRDYGKSMKLGIFLFIVIGSALLFYNFTNTYVEEQQEEPQYDGGNHQ